jgi:four helix bundle protein
MRQTIQRFNPSTIKLMNDYAFPFEKLRVWQDAREWISSVHEITENFPKSENYNLTSQLDRASVSVAANLAEGAGRTSMKDQAHFSQISYGSLMESACLTILASDRGYIDDEKLTEQRKSISGIANQINSLRKSQLSRAK